MEMDAFCETFREKKNAEGIAVGVTRIGVHSGNAIVGNFGGDLFFDYTAHGDAINTAARLEGVNKYLGTRICVSEKVAVQIPDFDGRPVGTLTLKGKTEGLSVFEPLPPDLADAPQTESYRRAYAKLEAGDTGASQAFAALVGQYGEDPLATFHLKRLLAGEKGVEITFGEK
jgi:adenylate cyclase